MFASNTHHMHGIENFSLSWHAHWILQLDLGFRDLVMTKFCWNHKLKRKPDLKSQLIFMQPESK